MAGGRGPAGGGDGGGWGAGSALTTGGAQGCGGGAVTGGAGAAAEGAIRGSDGTERVSGTCRTQKTPEQTEQRARTPSAGTLAGSTRKTV